MIVLQKANLAVREKVKGLKLKCINESSEVLSKYKVNTDVDKDVILTSCNNDYRNCLRQSLQQLNKETIKSRRALYVEHDDCVKKVLNITSDESIEIRDRDE
ncbi:unnamed protein product [Medioppia subpectinata]|uniref:Uncharacterized protein n=1 Tax=Medioppia subpectinata TaxID=1979941 RepID=A0A7R9KRG4_9ACAR|nr:unnamed protein product [Medioppia subpectinata]CAG2108446.1 unnamed protein product [Medioppia subpectinata]